MDLFKAYDWSLHDLIIAKLGAYVQIQVCLSIYDMWLRELNASETKDCKVRELDLAK